MKRKLLSLVLPVLMPLISFAVTPCEYAEGKTKDLLRSLNTPGGKAAKQPSNAVFKVVPMRKGAGVGGYLISYGAPGKMVAEGLLMLNNAAKETIEVKPLEGGRKLQIVFTYTRVGRDQCTYFVSRVKNKLEITKN